MIKRDSNGEIIVYSASNDICAKHIKGSGDCDCCCTSWIKHWENIGSDTRNECCVIYKNDKDEWVKCEEPAKEGAHVRMTDGRTSDWFIVPVCVHHNPPTDAEIFIAAETKFVRANKALTCEKS